MTEYNYKQLAVSFQYGVLNIIFNRQNKKNAIGVEMTIEINHLLQKCLTDSSVRVLVFSGAGENFSAGMDMKDFFDHTDRHPDELMHARQATNNWRSRLLRFVPQPILCAVEGYCLGGAFPILESADWVVASKNAVFGLPEINFGFVPGGPIAKSVGLSMSRNGASYASLTGRTFSADDALQWGLVSHICLPGLSHNIVLETAREIASFQQTLTT